MFAYNGIIQRPLQNMFGAIPTAKFSTKHVNEWVWSNQQTSRSRYIVSLKNKVMAESCLTDLVSLENKVISTKLPIWPLDIKEGGQLVKKDGDIFVGEVEDQYKLVFSSKSRLGTIWSHLWSLISMSLHGPIAHCLNVNPSYWCGRRRVLGDAKGCLKWMSYSTPVMEI